MSIRYSYHIGFVALLLLLAACTKDELADDARLPEGQYPLQIAAVTLSVEGGEAQPWGAPQTRVSENADGTGSVWEWDGSEMIGVQLGDKTTTYTLNTDHTLLADRQLYWTSTAPNQPVTAWYPATDGTLDLRDQDTNGLAYLLHGTGTGDYLTPVTLTFTHSLAKVRVTPTGDALGEVQSLQLYTYTQCTYEKGTVVQGSQEGWIEMKKCEYTENGNAITCWEANVVPGYTITKLMANNDNKERDLSAAITPEAGKFYNITLNYDKGYNLSADGRTYEVYNADGLLAWNEAVQKDMTLNCTLADNIDLTGKDWTPIGDYNNRYTGTFDGSNHTITGLTITTSDYFAGLFSFIQGTVKNVVLTEVNVTSGSFVGGVAGYSFGGNIENCSVSGIVSGNISAGGVVGYQSGGFITGCSSSATVNAGTTAGGVVGGTNSATLTGCYATGDVTIESINPGFNYAGGVVGGSNSSILIACYATGSVSGSGTNTYVGGLTGSNVIGTLTACYWSGFPDNDYGGATKVDGTTVTWQNAVDAMNAALQNAGSEWRYELTGALPALKKQ